LHSLAKDKTNKGREIKNNLINEMTERGMAHNRMFSVVHDKEYIT
jgi:hypothetical protein